MTEIPEVERISIYPNDYSPAKRKKLLEFLRDAGIQYSYEAY
jgi:hypothetical protein